MTRRRYTADQLAPVTRVMTATYRRPGDPTSGTRRECWEATTTDGQWLFQRVEGSGSPWIAQHLPTGYTPTCQQWSTLDDARADVVSGWLMRELWNDASWVLRQVPERPDPSVPVSLHDLARGVLTWLDERDLIPVEAAAAA